MTSERPSRAEPPDFDAQHLRRLLAALCDENCRMLRSRRVGGDSRSKRRRSDNVRAIHEPQRRAGLGDHFAGIRGRSDAGEVGRLVTRDLPATVATSVLSWAAAAIAAALLIFGAYSHLLQSPGERSQDGPNQVAANRPSIRRPRPMSCRWRRSPIWTECPMGGDAAGQRAHHGAARARRGLRHRRRNSSDVQLRRDRHALRTGDDGSDFADERPGDSRKTGRRCRRRRPRIHDRNPAGDGGRLGHGIWRRSGRRRRHRRRRLQRRRRSAFRCTSGRRTAVAPPKRLTSGEAMRIDKGGTPSRIVSISSDRFSSQPERLDCGSRPSGADLGGDRQHRSRTGELELLRNRSRRNAGRRQGLRRSRGPRMERPRRRRGCRSSCLAATTSRRSTTTSTVATWSCS